MAMDKNPHGSGQAAGGPTPGSGIAVDHTGCPVTGISIKRAIQRALLASHSAQPPQGTHIAGCGQPDPGPAAGAAGGGALGPGPGACPEPHAPPAGPTVVRQGRQRRVLSTDRRLLANRPDGRKRVRPVTDRPGFTDPALVKAKLRALAKDQGIKMLPGTGTLTLATRKVPGGREGVISHIRVAAADGDQHALVFLHVWDDLKKWEQKCSTLDDVCAAAGIAPVKLVKAVVGSAYEAGVDIANLVAAHAHPDVVASSVKFAHTADGIA